VSRINVETFSGTHYEIGVQQGQAVRALLHRTFAQAGNLVEVKSMKPRFVPMSLFLSLARRRATKQLHDAIVHYYPNQAARLTGIADGAGIDVSWLFFAQSMELLVTINSSIYHVPACTSFGCTPQRTRTQDTILAKNFDYPNHFFPLNLTCHVKPTGAYQTLGCTMAPLPGMLDGMNEHGLTVTQNLAYAIDEPTCFAPNSLALQEMLETCQTTDEAVQFITHTQRAGNHLLMIADVEDHIKTVEISHNYSAIRSPQNGQLINTNHYHTATMQQHEVPHDAVFTGDVAQEFRGIRVHESSEQRFQRAQELLTDIVVDDHVLATVLSDHGQNNMASNLTLCQHGDYLSTLRSGIFYPKRRQLKVLYGNPCQNTFSEFSFS